MKKLVGGLLALLLLVLPFVYIAGGHVDLSDKRDEIVAFLKSRTGADVSIDGPVMLGLSFSRGMFVESKDVRFAHGFWQVDVGRLVLVIDPLSLAQGSLIPERTILEKADIIIAPSASFDSQEKIPLILSAGKVGVRDSHLVLKNPDGTSYDVIIEKLSVQANKQSFFLNFRGAIGGVMSEGILQGDPLARIIENPWAFRVKWAYGANMVGAHGSLNHPLREVSFDEARALIGPTQLQGSFKLSYGKDRLFVQGKLQSPHLDLKTLSETGRAIVRDTNTTSTGEGQENDQEAFFSYHPFDKALWRALDARLDISLDEFVFGPSTAHNMTGQIFLSNGTLLASPLSMRFGANEAKGQMKFDLSQSVGAFGFLAKASNLDMSNMVEFGGAESLLSGRASLDISLTATGQSPHEMASNLNGGVSAVIANGSVGNSGLHDMLGTALDYFVLPGASLLTQTAVNCAVIRLKAVDGLIQTNGVLLDIAPGTFMLNGAMSLRNEMIGLRVSSRALGGFLPSVYITGSLAHPSFDSQIAATLQNAFQSLLHGNIPSSLSGVPRVENSGTGNGCVQALDGGGPVAQPLYKSGLGFNPFAGDGGGGIGAIVRNLTGNIRRFFGN